MTQRGYSILVFGPDRRRLLDRGNPVHGVGDERMTELRGGLFVHDDAIRLAVDLEARGHRLTVDRHLLVVSDGTKLTKTDLAAIQRLKNHLLAIAGYEVTT